MQFLAWESSVNETWRAGS